MRIWSIHPKYLDSKGLVALWRETLLAKNVFEGKTKGYKSHPQLSRFKLAEDSLKAVNAYLHYVWLEANVRSYNFEKTKYLYIDNVEKIAVTSGQLVFERKHLLDKLKKRDEKKFNEFIHIKNFETHPLFKQIIGEIEPWEKT